ncbi:MAG: FAD-dependent oxidoreductase [Proteobacteria bacterium]|jgi:D-amino-acid dehydrogenase|nr:FAD-dependent oxidoreductase [Pseudomonadota bacterium]
MHAMQIAVIGAGIVGATIAFELRKRGHAVTLVDRDLPGCGCSFGNSGAISEASVAPLAMPGVLASVPRMLLDRESPLRVPLAYAPRALPWLVRFVASATPSRVETSARELAALHAGAVARHLALAREVGASELVLERGHLYLYADRAALEKDSAAWELRRRYGHAGEVLDRTGILALEPAVHSRYTVAMFLRGHATVRNPLRYVEAIAKAFVSRGGTLRRAEATALARTASGWTVATTEDPLRTDAVVVAAGAWSRRLLDPQGLALPLETQRGYHVEFDGAAPVSRSVVLTDRKVFVTPMETGLRVGGTVEIAGLTAPPDWRRADALVAAVRAAFRDLDASPVRRWMGHRPCLPASVPYIGAVPGRSGLYAAVGHGHLGLTDAPATAERIAGLVASDLAVPGKRVPRTTS